MGDELDAGAHRDLSTVAAREHHSCELHCVCAVSRTCRANHLLSQDKAVGRRVDTCAD
jgi:hypothetical protein